MKLVLLRNLEKVYHSSSVCVCVCVIFHLCVCVCVWSMPSCRCHSLPAVLRLVFQIASLPPLSAAKNLKLNITFYHQQHKPDKPPLSPASVPVSSLPSLLTVALTSSLTHSSGHAAPFMMCPHSTHLLYQQCEGRGRAERGVANAKLLLNKHWILIGALAASAYSDRPANDYLSLPQKLQQMLKIDRVMVCTHRRNLGV